MCPAGRRSEGTTDIISRPSLELSSEKRAIHLCASRSDTSGDISYGPIVGEKALRQVICTRIPSSMVASALVLGAQMHGAICV